MPLWSNTDEAASAPKHTVNVTNGETGVEAYGKTPVGTFAVDAAEAATNGVPAGWNLKTEGSGGRAGRVFYESLVAMGSITGDGDSVPPLPVITIDTDPQNVTTDAGNNATFTVSASAVGTTTLSYQWQISTDTGASWNVMTGETSTSLVVANTDPEFVDANEFRVVVSGTNGAVSVTSANAVLTISA